MSICIPFNDDRQFKALTGLSLFEFALLIGIFSASYHRLQQEDYEKNKADRKRKPGGGQKGVLNTMVKKLFFILYYFKVYPTFDVMGNTFGLDRSKANTNVHRLAPVLQHCLQTLGVLPPREFKSIEDLKSAFDGIEDLIVDATERPHHRPQDNERQKEKYSGKKKRHTIKNTVISTTKKRILFLGYTVSGSIHDYTRFKDEFPAETDWFSLFKLWVDLGYLGIQKTYKALEIYIPHKKPRKSKNKPNTQLTPEQKNENTAMSKVRVAVENAIGGMKRFNIVTHIFRNRKEQFVDLTALITAGLWNWKLQCT